MYCFLIMSQGSYDNMRVFDFQWVKEVRMEVADVAIVVPICSVFW